MAVTIYRSTDTGAPALPANSNYAKQSGFMDVIKACLVTGYGSKPAAGWSMVYEDTTANKRRMAVSNGNGCLEFITWGTYSIGLVMWESITTPGVGRLYDDTFATVMSTGVNGWKASQIPAPGINSDAMNSIYLANFHTAYVNTIGWTVTADDKSCWLLLHWPSTSSSAEPADPLTTVDGYHCVLFFGAVKSPDLTRDQVGNFFLLNGSRYTTNTSNSGSSSNPSANYFWGLRTPFNTLPSVANASAFQWFTTTYASGANYGLNPRGSVRLITPILFSYYGNDVDKPAALIDSASAYYCFCAIPGLAQFGAPNTSGDRNFWIVANVDRGASWNMEPYMVNGQTWIPWPWQSYYNSCGLTDNASWWA